MLLHQNLLKYVRVLKFNHHLSIRHLELRKLKWLLLGSFSDSKRGILNHLDLKVEVEEGIIFVGLHFYEIIRGVWKLHANCSWRFVINELKQVDRSRKPTRNVSLSATYFYLHKYYRRQAKRMRKTLQWETALIGERVKIERTLELGEGSYGLRVFGI